MVGMQIDEDHDGEDERSDPGSDMDVDDERYIFFFNPCWQSLVILILFSKACKSLCPYRKPVLGRVKTEFAEPEAKDMVLVTPF